MPIFKYQAINDKGATVDGSFDADLVNEVEAWLLNNGMSPIKISISDDTETTEEKDVKVTLNQRLLGINIEEKILLCRQVATMLDAGVAILQALEIITLQTDNPLLRKIVKQVASDIEAGGNLSDSFAQFPNEFDTLFQNIIRVGEESGGLDVSFEYLARVFENEKEVTEKIKAATRYPKIVVTGVIGAIVFLMIFVVPKFMDMFANAKIELPLPTKILIWVSTGFTENIYITVAFAITCFFAYRFAMKSKDFVRVRDKMFLKFPVLGILTIKIYMSRFCRVFAVLSKSGIDIIRTLDLSATSVNNLVLYEIIEKVRMDVESGTDLYKSMSKHKLFPPMVVQMVSIGEKSGTLDMMMDKVSDFYETETDYSIKNLSTLIEPALLVIMGLIVGLLAMAIYMPMWNMMNVMK